MDTKITKIHRGEHKRFLESMLHRLPSNYECLDSSRTWCVYWILQAAYVINLTFPAETLQYVVDFLVKYVSKYMNINEL